MNKKCLSIAGFDGSGGAGIQADLKTFSALGCYGMTVLTALPIQNTCGVKNCYNIPVSAIEEQLETIFEDILPTSIKIGMLFSTAIINSVANFLQKHAKNIPIILDPVMIAKTGGILLLPDAIRSLKEKLIPLCTIITPNIPEAHKLINNNEKDFEKIAQQILNLGCQSILIKGGHTKTKYSNDLFMDNIGNTNWLKSERIESKNTHGTGCTLSAAICSFIAHGFSEKIACIYAKQYLFEAIKASKDNSVGMGHGPVDHFHHLSSNIHNFIIEAQTI
ncbi:MAG: bifunctional hydroxymethylpyrimidine kinase/phosphomethylpyrimidine kinase [Rickettsiales bacterium]|nr:bifunctional hydroxymethylpyrimidine kinase/phosphomethylpyrimidine kinase [Rickettsiales bacterium]